MQITSGNHRFLILGYPGVLNHHNGWRRIEERYCRAEEQPLCPELRADILDAAVQLKEGGVDVEV